jgi:hypothetical protein
LSCAFSADEWAANWPARPWRCSLLETEGWEDFDVHRRFVIVGDDDSFAGLCERGDRRMPVGLRPPSLCPVNADHGALLFSSEALFFELLALLIFMLVFHGNPHQYWALGTSRYTFVGFFRFCPVFCPDTHLRRVSHDCFHHHQVLRNCRSRRRLVIGRFCGDFRR